MSLGDEYDAEPMSTNMLEDICDRSQSHPIIDRIDARYKIRDSINQRREEWKGELISTQNTVKGLYKVF